ncbi:hypothetical protein [Anoxybacteroides tepidamans]|uniref:hypothetical protein n=1 Tax=Anoxybacteroides tepidamans TaxID=265948 RepID=UPI000A899527|nr:hypothetical protein [Anoxybacillus tepidamans]
MTIEQRLADLEARIAKLEKEVAAATATEKQVDVNRIVKNLEKQLINSAHCQRYY